MSHSMWRVFFLSDNSLQSWNEDVIRSKSLRTNARLFFFFFGSHSYRRPYVKRFEEYKTANLCLCWAHWSLRFGGSHLRKWIWNRLNSVQSHCRCETWSFPFVHSMSQSPGWSYSDAIATSNCRGNALRTRSHPTLMKERECAIITRT